ncbi:MAG: DUF5606 domain-containing protein [Bacteroidales bacterium]|nr:DUF5606 domain-containing protein [Bacteroidales bacterium]
MKTDLSKILSVSGKHGLYQYIAQARNGVIAEALSDHKRTVFDAHTRLTTLADISIFTHSEEMKLSEVFLALQKVLGDKNAPAGKGTDAALKALFAEAVPEYDEDRFYVSHMHKVAEWYNDLVNYASLDFEVPEETD